MYIYTYIHKYMNTNIYSGSKTCVNHEPWSYEQSILWRGVLFRAPLPLSPRPPSISSKHVYRYVRTIHMNICVHIYIICTRIYIMKIYILPLSPRPPSISCKHVYRYIRTYIHAHTYTHTRVHAHVYRCICTYIHAHTCTGTYAYTYTHKRVQVYTHIHIRTHMYRYIRTCIHAQTCTCRHRSHRSYENAYTGLFCHLHEGSFLL